MEYEVKNKVALVTGAASGIGESIVRFLIKEGAKYVLVLDINEAAGVALEKELNSKFNNQKVKFIKCDISDETQLLGGFKTVLDDNGTIDIVINNAGIMNDSLTVYKKSIEVNFTALVTSTLKALELMRKDLGGKGGTIINVSSAAALMQISLLPIYSGAKSAVLQFSNCIGLPEYYEKTGVRVIAMCFSATNTGLFSPKNVGCVDEANVEIIMNVSNMQSAECAALGVLEAYKKGESGSTWMVANGGKAKDITGTVRKAYELLSSVAY